MIALDTNVLARLLLADDPAQFAQAKALLAEPRQYTAPITVLLELVWVLEVNDIQPKAIAAGLHQLLGLPNFHVESLSGVQQALNHYAQGMDFADALHLVTSPQVSRIATFDKRFAKLSTKLSTTPRVGLVGTL